jgi:hypothetical protein
VYELPPNNQGLIALAPLAGGAALALSPPDADDGTNGLWAAVGDED